jgi:hypothetical protein
VASPHPHLPPGRAPGRQSRHLKTGSTIFVVIAPIAALLFLVVFVPVGLLLGSPLFVAAGVAGAGAFAGVGFMFWRRSHPRVAKHFTLALDAIEVRRGETVTARLELHDPSRVGERLEVGLECEVRYDLWERHRDADGTGYDRSRTTRIEKAWEHWVPASRSERVQAIPLEVPRDGPYSHEGSCLSFSWRVTAREPTPRRSDPARREPIWVLP